MDDEDSEQIKTKRKKSKFLKGNFASSLLIFQSIWIRCCPIFLNKTYGKYLERQLNYVLYCGMFFWIVYLFL